MPDGIKAMQILLINNNPDKDIRLSVSECLSFVCISVMNQDDSTHCIIPINSDLLTMIISQMKC